MTGIPGEVLPQVVAVALSSGAEPVGRVANLAELAEACLAAGDPAAAEGALVPALELLTTAASRPGSERRELASAALAVGQSAYLLERADLAREAYLAAAAALEHDRGNEMLPAAWLGAGWASVSEGRGPEAVEYMRNAAGLADERLTLTDRIEVLRALAEAERAWGDDWRCDSALLAGCEAIRREAAANALDRSTFAPLADRLRSCAERLEREAPEWAAGALAQGLGGGE